MRLTGKSSKSPEAAGLNFDLEFDPLQIAVLRSASPRGILNCSRQWGKATVAAVKAIERAHSWAGSLVLVASPSAGKSYSVREFPEVAGGIRRGGLQEACGNRPTLLPTDRSGFSAGDSGKMRRAQGWQPEISFEELVAQMVECDLETARQEGTLIRGGHKFVQQSDLTYA